MIRLLIAGSRELHPEDWEINQAINLALAGWETYELTIVSGGARGVDTAGESWALAYGYPVETYIPKWDEYGKGAGYVRNTQMVAVADAAVIFWDGSSRGTKHTIGLVQEKGIPYVLIGAS